ncbi:MAG: glycosyltransferase family 39 protein [Pseudomonadota bacterium]
MARIAPGAGAPRQVFQPQHALVGFIAGLIALSGARLFVSTGLPLFGDEAFYWLESRHLAWAFSDLPPATAAGIFLSSSAAGQSYLGVRVFFVLLSTVWPLLIYGLSRQLGAGQGAALVAGLLGAALPTAGLLAPFALPVVLLNTAWLLAAWLLAAQLTTPATWRWLALGAVLAVAVLTHYRALPLLAGVGILVLYASTLRRQLRTPGPWLALILIGAAAWPQVTFNLTQDFAALSFQFVDRHPWQFDLKGLRLPLIDLVLLTPVLAWLMLRLLWRLLRNPAGPGHAVPAALGLIPLAIYWLASPWVDTDRVSFHWTLGAWLTLCAGLPPVLQPWLAGGRLRRGLLALTITFGLAAAITLQLLWVSSARNPEVPLASGDLVSDNFLGWPQAADRARRLAEEYNIGTLAGDYFMPAAQLSFELGQEVYALDHPLNHKHGRDQQLAIWALDRVPPGERALLVSEISALDFARQPAWNRAVCEQFPGAAVVARLDLFGGRKTFLFWLLDPHRTGACNPPAYWYLDVPRPRAAVDGRFEVIGWAFEDGQGVAAVEILHADGTVSPAEYGLARPGVVPFFGDVRSPNHPAVGFRAELDAGRWAPGAHELRLRVIEVDGSSVVSPPFTVLRSP